MSFMKPQYLETSGLLIETEFETVTWPDVHNVALAETLDLLDGPVVNSEKITGIFYRLSAPGFMDCTDWGFANTLEGAKESLSALYDINPDTGETL